MDRSWVYRVITYSLLTLVAFVVLDADAGDLGRQRRQAAGLDAASTCRKRSCSVSICRAACTSSTRSRSTRRSATRPTGSSSDIEERLQARQARQGRQGRPQRPRRDRARRSRIPADAKKLDREFLKDYPQEPLRGVARPGGRRGQAAHGPGLRRGAARLRRASGRRDHPQPRRQARRVGADHHPQGQRHHRRAARPQAGRLRARQEADRPHRAARVQDGRRRLGVHEEGRRPRAGAKKTEFPGIEIAHDGWSEKDSGQPHSDVYLRDKDKGELEKFFASLTGDDAVPPDHEIGYEQKETKDEDGNSTSTDKLWRTYYLHRRAELTGEYITDAEVSLGSADRPPRGLAHLRPRRRRTSSRRRRPRTSAARWPSSSTRRSTRRRCIEGRIGGGHARITMGGYSDPFQLQEEAKDLVAVLEGGRAAGAAQEDARDAGRPDARQGRRRQGQVLDDRRLARSSSSSCSSTTACRASSPTSRWCSTSSTSWRSSPRSAPR